MRRVLMTCCVLTAGLWLGGSSVDARFDGAGIDEAPPAYVDDGWLRERSALDFEGLGFRAAGSQPPVGDAPSATPSAAPVSVPLPPAAWPGAVGLVGVGTLAIRRFRRR